jgi:FkbM family methyltransferase
MSTPNGDHFRTRTLSERLAEALPSGAGFASLRRWLRPLFVKWLASSNADLQSVLPGGEVVLVSPTYRHISWNRDEYAAFKTAVRPGDVVLEAGANVGAYTMLFAQWVGASGRVFAFEPDPSAYAGLQDHVAMNNVADRVTAVAAAVADGRDACVRLAIGESSGISRIASDRQATSTQTRDVPAVSIDQFCVERDIVPRVIKIDVEGAEMAVLAGARETIAAAGSALQLFVEMHPHLWPELGLSADSLRRECEAQGLVAEQLDGSVRALWETDGICLRLRPGRGRA